MPKVDIQLAKCGGHVRFDHLTAFLDGANPPLSLTIQEPMPKPRKIDADQPDRLFMTGASVDEVSHLFRDHHYSGTTSTNIQHAFAWREKGGLFGDTGEPRAAILYSFPINKFAPKGSIELVRLVRDEEFSQPLSKFVAWTLRWLKVNTKWEFCLSYSDTTQGHHGGIYQACNFTYVNETGRYNNGIVHPESGQFKHGRSCVAEYGTRGKALLERLPEGWEASYSETKYFYVFPLRKKLKRVLSDNNWEAKPYPKPGVTA